jgi:hypothetical protein
MASRSSETRFLFVTLGVVPEDSEWQDSEVQAQGEGY